MEGAFKDLTGYLWGGGGAKGLAHYEGGNVLCKCCIWAWYFAPRFVSSGVFI